MHNTSFFLCVMFLSGYSQYLHCLPLQLGHISGVGMTDTPPSDGPSQGAEFDMMSALDWKDGIATLPGSDIRV